ncbi:sterol desaturase family protein [Seongchinamella unica]|uniref:Sterol desaturase family protein n=1 Tax=Seongchinamella unica TaxID=2547392 RepID=A0A4R5LTF0_9GAMM|nr:sterol desaturase family protein [Seongchinamella unica]TDG14027.1 sterol desaturase family protein [Seongchinamella unica]
MEQVATIEEPLISIYVFTAIVYAVLIVAESLLPRRDPGNTLIWRWTNNFSIGILSWYLSAVVGTWMLIWATQADLLSNYRLSDYFGNRPVQGFLALLVISQLVSYWFHRAFHRFSWLWPLHAVHHADTEFDVSTSYRHHPLEPLVSLPVMVPIVLLLGVNAESAFSYRLFAVAATLFSHSNIRIHQSLERPLRRVFLTPDFHRIHHCSEQQYTDSNFGSLVPWFDYLFGTARHRPAEDQPHMELGLEYLREPRECRLDRQLLMPLSVPRAINQHQEP